MQRTHAHTPNKYRSTNIRDIAKFTINPQTRHTYIHTHKHAHTHTHVHTRMHAHADRQTDKQTDTHTHARPTFVFASLTNTHLSNTYFQHVCIHTCIYDTRPIHTNMGMHVYINSTTLRCMYAMHACTHKGITQTLICIHRCMEARMHTRIRHITPHYMACIYRYIYIYIYISCMHVCFLCIHAYIRSCITC